MKNKGKLLLLLIPSLLLTSCDNYGPEISEEEAKAAVEKMHEKCEEVCPRAQEITIKLDCEIKSDIHEDFASKNEITTISSIDVDNLVLYEYSHNNLLGIEDVSEMWSFFKDGYFYLAYRQQYGEEENAMYYKREFEEDEAKKSIENALYDYFDSCYEEETMIKNFGSSIKDSLPEAVSAFDIPLNDLDLSEVKYYSKGNGNLTYVVKQEIEKKNTLVGNIKLDYDFNSTIDNYIFKNANLKTNISIKDKDNKNVLSINVNGNATFKDSCNITIPDLTNFREI